MKVADKDTLRAILTLRGNPAWERVITWIRDSYVVQSHENNFVLDSDRLTRNQGRNMELHELLVAIEKAEEHYKRMSETQKSVV